MIKLAIIENCEGKYLWNALRILQYNFIIIEDLK